jgi:hypothetical protein
MDMIQPENWNSSEPVESHDQLRAITQEHEGCYDSLLAVTLRCQKSWFMQVSHLNLAN